MEAALAGFAGEVERGTGCANLRAYVMLPMAEDRQMVIYQYGMRGSPDMEWNIGIQAGPSGRVHRDKKSCLAEWQNMRVDPGLYNLSDGEASQIAPGRQIVYCVPCLRI